MDNKKIRIIVLFFKKLEVTEFGDLLRFHVTF